MLKALNVRFVADTFSEAPTDISGFATLSRQVSKRTAREVADELHALSRRLAEAARRDQATLPPEELEARKLVTAWGAVSYEALTSDVDR
ncbi:MAG: hypothetical protein AAF318_20060 [Pseudomonadota bacterium]